MVYLVFMLIKPLRHHSCPVDGGTAKIKATIMACPALWDVNCLINSGTTPVWKHLLSIYLVALIYSSVSIILAVNCTHRSLY
jgi:hypothetical protein